ncbi:MAG: HAMP domain-containing protein [Nitrospirae bacterium]|nr:HAMP domain-containing protein [Nitrospirota bacterium]
MFSNQKSLAGRFLFHISWFSLLIGSVIILFSKTMIENELQNATIPTDEKIKNILWIHIGSIAFLIPSGIAVAVLLLKILTRPLKEMTLMTIDISKGDFSRRMAVKSNDELDALAKTLNQMTDNLKRVILRFQEFYNEVVSMSLKILSSSEKVTQSTSTQVEFVEKTKAVTGRSLQEISDGISILLSASDTTSSSLLEMGASIGDISNQTEALSSAVDTTSASLIEMTSSIKEVSENVVRLSITAEKMADAVNAIDSSVKEVERIAKEAAQISEKVSSDAHELGVQAIVKTIEGMKKIKGTVEKTSHVIKRLGKSSEEIGKILTVINEVTKQTNLLALNAAILAAQAGEQGKGFTVVAEEIKKLADKTALSTNEISHLISNVQTETRDAVNSIQIGYESVEEGMRFSLAAGDAVGKILESSKTSALMARKIEEATGEQVKGICTVKGAVEEITSMSKEIVRATREQKKGGEQIMNATEKMRMVSKKVRLSTEEQVQGSRQITQAAENVNSKIQGMVKAIDEQKKWHDLAGASIVEIEKIAYSHFQMANEMTGLIRQLVKQTELLKEDTQQIKV